MAYDVLNADTLLYGGVSSVLRFADDTWTWDGTNWTLHPSVNTPDHRNSFAIAYDDTERRVILFGGQGPNYGAGDTWTWDGTNWLQIASQVDQLSRYTHAMAFDSVRHQVVMFGGFLSGPLGDTWIW
jgi:hypothetical protein